MSAIFDGSLSPQQPQAQSNYAAIRPISRLWFELSDKTAFDDCIAMCVEWMGEVPRHSQFPRSGIALPPEAKAGQSFDVTDEFGANPAKAVRIDASDGALWAARLDYHDSEHPRTWVSEFFVERRLGHLSRFGAQLTCVIRGEIPPFEITRPNVVRQVLERLSAEADGRALVEGVDKTERRDVSELENLLYDVNRRLPVLAISETEDGRTGVSPALIARKVAGAAHIVYLSKEASWELTRTIGKRMSVFNGAVRLYLPQLSEDNEDPFEHPLWLFQDGLAAEIASSVAARVLPSAFLSRGGPSEFPRYTFVKDIAAKLNRSRMADPDDFSRTELETLRLDLKSATEESETWQSIALEEQAKRISSERDIEKFKSEIIRLETKTKALEYRIESRVTGGEELEKLDRPLESYDDLDDWADEVLGDHVYIHQAAIKECRKHGHQNMLRKVEASLIIIRDYIVPYKMNGGLQLFENARRKLAEIGMSDSACFVDREEAARRPGYSVPYEGRTEYLYDHIKFGNGYDNANQVRIYYFWDGRGKRFVIGKMPSHLRNNLTS